MRRSARAAAVSCPVRDPHGRPSCRARALKRVDHLLAEGVTTLEIKSGYGLDIASELKMLRVARLIGEMRPVHVRTTWLAAHALPPEICRRPRRLYP